MRHPRPIRPPNIRLHHHNRILSRTWILRQFLCSGTFQPFQSLHHTWWTAFETSPTWETPSWQGWVCWEDFPQLAIWRIDRDVQGEETQGLERLAVQVRGKTILGVGRTSRGKSKMSTKVLNLIELGSAEISSTGIWRGRYFRGSYRRWTRGNRWKSRVEWA